MSSNDSFLIELKGQEKTLQFSEFTNETALKLGMILIENAKKSGKSISIDITRSGHKLFHYSFEGTSPDNDQWMARKSNTVNRFQTSSMYISALLRKIGRTMEEEYCISSMEYASAGGAFPIIIKDVGVIGTIAVSGLAQEEDHEMVVEAIGKYLESKLG